MFLKGYRINIVDGIQSQLLSDKVDVTDKFRLDTNKWLADFFGYERILRDEQAIKDVKTKTISMNRFTFNKFYKKAVNAEARLKRTIGGKNDN